VIAEFEKELERAQEPGYASRYDEGYAEDAGDEVGFEEESFRRSTPEGQQTHVEPAEATPPPPHHAAKPSPTTTPPRPRTDTFGAGIFDE
jgi:hypothetical protein